MTAMRIILLLSCPDQRGIVARVSSFIEHQRGNIIDSMQHNAIDTQTFFMRVEWDWSPADERGTAGEGKATSSPSILKKYKADLDDAFQKTVAEFNMNYQIWITDELPRVAVMVSRHLHCLSDLLLRWRERRGCAYEMACVISNHNDARNICDWVGVPFHHIPVDAGSKAEAERKQIALLQQYRVDTIVLARYMQILSASFVSQHPHAIINIHHSFLPAFVGAKPYHQAYERGVKVVGGTSHYVTERLDQGPIIEQRVHRISHRDTVEDIVNIGKDLERTVLNRAVELHLQRRVYVYGNKTVVFD